MRTADSLPVIHVRAMIDELIVLVLVVRGTVCILENSVIQLTDSGDWLKFFFHRVSNERNFHYRWGVVVSGSGV